jgi:8-oxo-dGTP pyrophosphatase MutT (NUDIX family)
VKQKTKVIAYITRVRKNQIEILVFKHRDFEEAGIQVIGGTVDRGEDILEALLREIKEESGLEFQKNDIKKFIGNSTYLKKNKPELNLRHYYQLDGSHLGDDWEHEVQSTGNDNGLIFNFYWLTLKDASKKLTGNFAELFHEII